VGGATWRHLHRSLGDRCRDCGRCDLGADGHECSLTPAWFAGVATVCHSCFAQLIRDELNSASDTVSPVHKTLLCMKCALMQGSSREIPYGIREIVQAGL